MSSCCGVLLQRITTLLSYCFCSATLILLVWHVTGPRHLPLSVIPPFAQHYVCYITLHSYVCWGVLAFICTVVTDVTTGSFGLYWYWFTLHTFVCPILTLVPALNAMPDAPWWSAALAHTIAWCMMMPQPSMQVSSLHHGQCHLHLV